MAKREIKLIGDEVLRKEARKVKKFDKTLHKLIDDMVETMREAPGIGLAAPQVGLLERVIVVELPEDEEDPQSGKLFEFVNPEIVFESDDASRGRGGLPVDSQHRRRRVARRTDRDQGPGPPRQAAEAGGHTTGWRAPFSTRSTTSTACCSSTGSKGPQHLRRLVKVRDENGEEYYKAIPMTQLAPV